ncbi:MAG: hypothetical protein K2K57_13985 [Oscillospiraceae bacterium]|nr:hypothetical protein [Oscillospiraceae bacterium]
MKGDLGVENEKIVVWQKKSATVLYIAACIFACLIMIVFALNVTVGDGRGLMGRLLSTETGVVIAKIFYAIAAGLCIYGAVFFIKRLTNPKPLIIADEKGFTDSSSASPAGFIPWSDVKNIYMVTLQRNKLIEVELVNSEEYLSRHSGLSRKLAEVNMKMGYQAISLSLGGTDTDPDKFLCDITALWERNR